MRIEEPYNPLDKKNLGTSVADALLARAVEPLPPAEAFIGVGVYAIYYVGDYPAYQSIAARNQDEAFNAPIYVGKAVPEGARKGGLLAPAPSRALFKRLWEHARSIKEARNLELKDFFCRYLAVDDVWIPLGEALMIERFSPLWNKVIDGFGIHTPGKGRFEQQRSLWDVLHPGRAFADKLRPGKLTEQQILELVAKATGDNPPPAP